MNDTPISERVQQIARDVCKYVETELYIMNPKERTSLYLHTELLILRMIADVKIEAWHE